jgi:DNA-directed RNA polymerase specialized sigma24 family protein
MSSEDWSWLSSSAGALCAGDTIDPEDLLIETLARYYGGQRAWNDAVPLRTQFRNAMRSILFSWRKARKRLPQMPLDELLDQLELEDFDGCDDVEAVGSPEGEAYLQQVLSVIERAFENDEVALDVFSGMSSGMSPRDIQESLGIDKTTYESTQKRIRRRLAKLRESGETQ